MSENLCINVRKVDRVRRGFVEEGPGAALGDNIGNSLKVTESRLVVASHGPVGSCSGMVRIGFPFGTF